MKILSCNKEVRKEESLKKRIKENLEKRIRENRFKILNSVISRAIFKLLTDDSNAETRGCQPCMARRTCTPESRASVDSRFASRRAGIIPLGLTGETAESAALPWIGHRSCPANNPARNIDCTSRAASCRFCTPASCLAARTKDIAKN